MTAARQDAPATLPPDYAHLLCAARRMFEPDELERLIPRARGGPLGRPQRVFDEQRARELLAENSIRATARLMGVSAKLLRQRVQP